jgi:hypothetical protein
MTPKDLIGKRISDILVRHHSDPIENDETIAVFIVLYDGVVVDFPIDFERKDIEKKLESNLKSLFTFDSKTPINHIIYKDKKYPDYEDETRNINIFCRIFLELFGLVKFYPEGYRIRKIDSLVMKTKLLKDQVIVDLIEFDMLECSNEFIGCFFELENGIYISSVYAANLYNGNAGINYFDNFDDLRNYLKDCKCWRLSSLI